MAEPIRKEFKLARDQWANWQKWIERAAQEAEDNKVPDRDQMEITFRKIGVHPL